MADILSKAHTAAERAYVLLEQAGGIVDLIQQATAQDSAATALHAAAGALETILKTAMDLQAGVMSTLEREARHG